MSSTLRTLSKQCTHLSRAMQQSPSSSTAGFHSTPVHRFRSPFNVLAPAPSAAASAGTGAYHPTAPAFNPYEKSPDPGVEELKASAGGARTYVVSEPDPAHTPYSVPAGAFPTSQPYVQYAETAPPDTDAPPSSTGTGPAHPVTTGRVPRNDAGVGESAAVRNAEAPGELGARGGSKGGLGLMDEGSTKGTNELAGRNPQPDSAVAEQFSKEGVDNAWKSRK